MDFGFKESNSEGTYSEIDKSILARRTDYSSGNKNNQLTYTIFESNSTLVIKFYEKRLDVKLNRYGTDLKRISTNLPNSIVAYSDNEKGSFVLVMKDKVVDIKKDFSGYSDNEFLDIVYKKLLY